MANKKMHYQFLIVKWDDTGNVLLERKLMTVQRQTQYNARTVVRRKYPRSEGYLEELNNSWCR